jgi:hypothetical protein
MSDSSEHASPHGARDPRQRAASPSSDQRPPQSWEAVGGSSVVVIICLLLLGLGMTLIGNHWSRRVACFLISGGTIAAGVCLSQKRSIRLGCVAGGLGTAFLAFWFLPTMRGDNYWSAWRQSRRLVADYEVLTGTDVSGYSEIRRQRELLMNTEHPDFRQDFESQIEQAEQARGLRAVAAAEAELSTLAADDITTYQNRCPDREVLAQRFQSLRQRIADAETGWFRRVLEAERRLNLELVRKDRFRAAATRAQALRAKLTTEAERLSLSEDLESFCDGYRYLAGLAERAERPDPK